MTLRYALAVALLICGRGAFAQVVVEQNCAALSAGDAERVRNIRVMSAIPQDDVRKHTLPMIRTQVQPGAGMGSGGLIGAIVGGIIADAIINSQIQKDVERATLAFAPLIEQVKDFDFRGQFWARLEWSLDEDSRFRVLEIATFDSERGYVEQPQTVRGERVDAVLDLRTEYALSADLRVFVIRTSALLQSQPDGRELYRCRYAFATPPVAAGSYEAAITAWAADEAALYRAAAVIGMQQTLKMLRYDLVGADAPRPSGEEVSLTAAQRGVPSPGAGPVPSTANVVEREDNLIIARDRRGVMRSVMQDETFAPSPETVAGGRGAAGRAPGGPVQLDDLIGAMDGEKPAIPEAKPAPPPAEAPQARRAAGLDDLGGLLGE